MIRIRRIIRVPILAPVSVIEIALLRMVVMDSLVHVPRCMAEFTTGDFEVGGAGEEDAADWCC